MRNRIYLCLAYMSGNKKECLSEDKNKLRLLGLNSIIG